MIPLSLSPSDFFPIKQTPESREAAVSDIIEGWHLEAVSKTLEDQINPGLKDSAQILNVTDVCRVQVKAINKFCVDRIRDLNKDFADRVDSISKRFNLIAAHFEKNGNVRDIKDECATLKHRIFTHELNSDAIVLISEARLKAIQDVWVVQMERLEQNPFKAEAQHSKDEVMNLTRSIHREVTRQAEEVQLRSRNVLADLRVMQTENTCCKDPQARIEEIKFIDAYILATANEDTQRAFQNKNEEATPFFIFLMVYWFAFGNLRKKVLPWFLPHRLRQEIQHLRNEAPSEDRSIQQLRQEKFFCDYKEFPSWKYALKDNPTLEKLVKVSEKMLEDKEFTSTFVDCWHACVEFEGMSYYDIYESFQALKKERAEAEASLALSKAALVRDRDSLLESATL